MFVCTQASLPAFYFFLARLALLTLQAILALPGLLTRMTLLAIFLVLG